MQWNHPQSAHVPLLSAPTGYTKYLLLPVCGCWLSSFICHPKNMHSSGVCSWLLHASLMLASVDILPPARKPPLTPIHCQYDHRRPNPQRLSSIYGVWINHHRYSGRLLMLMCTVVVKKIATNETIFLVSIRRRQSNPALWWTYVEGGGWYHLHHRIRIGASSMRRSSFFLGSLALFG